VLRRKNQWVRHATNIPAGTKEQRDTCLILKTCIGSFSGELLAYCQGEGCRKALMRQVENRKVSIMPKDTDPIKA